MDRARTGAPGEQPAERRAEQADGAELERAAAGQASVVDSIGRIRIRRTLLLHPALVRFWILIATIDDREVGLQPDPAGFVHA